MHWNKASLSLNFHITYALKLPTSVHTDIKASVSPHMSGYLHANIKAPVIM